MVINIQSVLLLPSEEMARLINLHNYKNYPCIKCNKICSFGRIFWNGYRQLMCDWAWNVTSLYIKFTENSSKTAGNLGGERNV
jgi:hypothetical protein